MSLSIINLIISDDYFFEINSQRIQQIQPSGVRGLRRVKGIDSTLTLSPIW
ncbi:hypothetical protein M595_3372 [Lyngbya aestuarii BL J]|uniref:Uncharacterized protein n=1 Tax=Lyngbya aestuarii BL J TaxID=1348334 RepID=U7QFJ9_9CYAN|nr:hypothetical protein M595_3372 [Lyngbya aestuarii BL J]